MCYNKREKEIVLMIYYSSDYHRGHGNIIKYCLRGYGPYAARRKEFEEEFNSDFDAWVKNSVYSFKSTEEMDDVIINRVNEKVKKDDILYNLGDFSMGNLNDAQEYFDRIECENVYFSY